MTPFPSMKVYPWMRSDAPIDVTAALQILRRMKYQAPEPTNPQRWRAFNLAIDAVDTIAHKHDISYFKPAKLHALLCAAAAEAGWFRADPSQRPALPDAPAGCKCCADCVQFLPLEMFKAKRDRMSQFCADCRKQRETRKAQDAEAKAKRALIKRFETAVCMDTYDMADIEATQEQFEERRKTRRKAIPTKGNPNAVRLCLPEILTQTARDAALAKARALSKDPRPNHLMADAYEYYALRIQTARDTSRRLRGESTYHETRYQLLAQAQQALDALLDDARLSELLRGQHHWTKLLNVEQLVALRTAHASAYGSVGRGSKHKPLVTIVELNAWAAELRKKYLICQDKYQQHRLNTRRQGERT
jgi:hypothetical protein